MILNQPKDTLAKQQCKYKSHEGFTAMLWLYICLEPGAAKQNQHLYHFGYHCKRFLQNVAKPCIRLG